MSVSPIADSSADASNPGASNGINTVSVTDDLVFKLLTGTGAVAPEEG